MKYKLETGDHWEFIEAKAVIESRSYVVRIVGVCTASPMDREPIHKNLSTSFVDLEALVNHLKDLQFVGVVHIELSSYEAEIVFTAPHELHVRELDHFGGRSVFGPAALKRTFERVRGSFGRIHVYRSTRKPGSGRNESVFIDESISARARETVFSKSDTPAYHLVSLVPAAGSSDYSNLVAELLRTVQTSLRNAQLDFPEAFRNTCSSLSAVYPFLHPKFGAVRFNDEIIKLDVRVTEKQFTDALLEVLGIIISRVPELATRPGAMDSVRSSLEQFAERRVAELERIGLDRLPDRLLER
jgi:hypothetical protein